MPRKRFPEDVRARKRGEILDGAMAVFERDGGLKGLSFRKLAAEMQLSYSAPYRYFADKNELVNALRARAYRWIEREMLDAIDGVAAPEKRLELLAAAYIRSGMRRPQRYALMFFNLNDADVARRSLELKAAKRDALDVCTRTIAAGQASGDLPQTMDPLTAAHLFWIGAHGLVSLQVAGQFVMGRSIEILVPALIGTLRVGMEHYKAPQAQNETQEENPDGRRRPAS
ncbi:MAG: TetR/AcrR family transcriptional regulator [Nevskiaceae bacterium]|nr:MAG: TetR/AcrR family transcriptional regulator [Nevskiaceae bacterium]TBR72601.1 MAG: TetR/AcrR family transcriptional regulator [Nevskiaceae bacterium]